MLLCVMSGSRYPTGQGTDARLKWHQCYRMEGVEMEVDRGGGGDFYYFRSGRCGWTGGWVSVEYEEDKKNCSFTILDCVDNE